MAGITRKTGKIFGGSLSAPNNIAVFGSLKAAAPAFSLDPSVIQSAAWQLGWGDAVVTVGGNPNVPPLQDVNAIEFVLSYLICYILERGIPEYDAGTTYNLWDFCRKGGVVFISLADANIGNDPATPSANWTSQQAPAAASNTGGQSITVDGNGYIVQFATGIFDPDGRFNTGTYRYTAPIAGVYQVSANVQVDNVNASLTNTEISLRIVKNGASVLLANGTNTPNPAGARWYPSISSLVQLGAEDTVEIQIEGNDGVGTHTFTLANGQFSINLVRPL